MSEIDPKTTQELEAAVFQRLVKHVETWQPVAAE